MKNYARVVRFMDKSGKWHKYLACFINGEMTPQDKKAIKEIAERR